MSQGKPRFEYEVIGCEGTRELLSQLRAESADGWEPKLYLGAGQVLLQRSCTEVPTPGMNEDPDISLVDDGD